MAATTSTFHLTSTQTALALLVPKQLQGDVNSLRQIHDKSYTKWPAHINILYPFIEPSLLPAAISLIESFLLSNAQSQPGYSSLRVRIDEAGVFRHRKNATVFLKPDVESEERLRELRRGLEAALGCEEGEGTIDGVYRPHLTVGQASLLGGSVEKLVEQVQKVVGLEWNGRGLVVLKREGSGEMKVVEELGFGDGADEEDVDGETEWKSCFELKNGEWKRYENVSLERRAKLEISISSYNLMAEPLADPISTRLPLIIDALSSVTTPTTSSLRVLCLQEVNDEILPLLLDDPYLRQTYPYSTHQPSSLLVSDRNLVTLASQPFASVTIQFEERHKSALVVSFRNAPIILANIHLTSALTEKSILSKKAQVETLTKFLLQEEKKTSKEILIVGDFNLTTSSRTLSTALSRNIITSKTAILVKQVIDTQIWDEAFVPSEGTLLGHDGEEVFEGEDGATFDRSTNPLAAMLEPPIDRSPQRYDRMLFRRGGRVEREGYEVFGLPNGEGRCGSDHYGVSACLRITSAGDSKPAPKEKISRLDRITVIEDSTDLQPLIDPYLPSEADRVQRKSAIKLLQDTLCRGPGLTNLILAPLGSYLMDTYFADSDVDVLAIGSIAPSAFFEFASSELSKLDSSDDDESSFKGVHFVNSLVSIVEVCVSGIKFDLQYCQAAELLHKYHSIMPSCNLTELTFNKSLIATLSPSSIRPLNTYRDTAYLLTTLPSLPSYRLAHRYLSLYLKSRGLYSAKFGYLGGIHLSLMLNRLAKLTAITRPDAPISPATIIRTFFSYYASFNWAAESVTDPLLEEGNRSARTQRDSLFIPAIHVPTARPNVASSCTRLTGQTLTKDFTLASQHLSSGDWSWALRSKQACIQDFINGFSAFVRVGIDVWDVDVVGGDRVRETLGSLESRFPRLMVALGRIGGLEGRVWPARFRVINTAATGKAKVEEEDQSQFKGYYLIGTSAPDDLEASQKKVIEGKVVTVVREFERGVLEAKEFSGGNCWVSMDLIPRKKILSMDLVLDTRDWGAKPSLYTIQTPNHPPIDISEPYNQTSTITLAVSPSSQVQKERKERRKASSGLRPAQDIIARIKWDPELDIGDYLIGYEDRFVGVKEMELGRWKGESTDEEFIPLHRVVWVRRKHGAGNSAGVGEGGGGAGDGGGGGGGGDGEIVWDRRRKVDLVCGSGISGG